MMNQKEATVSTILGVLAERDVEYVRGGDVPISDVLTDVDKSNVRTALFSMFRNGDVSFKAEFQAKVNDDAELKKYISGLVNNWLRKDKDFNCGQKYVAKNPGSRANSKDAQITELKKLSAQYSNDAEALAEITDAIVARQNEIAATKAKSVVINTDALPEALKHLVKS